LSKIGSHAKSCRPIGVFDSGLGGLTVVREIRRQLPEEAIIYFGDIAHLPYGTKSREQILRFSIQNTLFLLKHKVKAMVVACNSSASAASPFLRRHFNLPIVDVVEPVVDSALEATRSGRVGVIATQATVDSRIYERSLKKRNPKLKVFSCSCPLFVPLVEEGWLYGKITYEIAGHYLKEMKAKRIDVLILGCTHYPLLGKAIARVMGPSVRLVDSIAPTVKELISLLDIKQIRSSNPGEGELRIYVSDKPRNFIKVGEPFLGETLHHVEVVRSK
jgi:glutamate racemase